MITAVWPPRGNFARLQVGFFGLVLVLAGGLGVASDIRKVGIHGHVREILMGLVLAVLGLGMLLTAILRKGNEVPFDY